MNDYRYHLETPKVTGQRQKKFTCPQCGRRKCFVRYVDTKNGCCYVADNVGKCDHQHSCGYHYTPSEYYRDNQWAKAPAVDCKKPYMPPPLPPFQPLSKGYVLRSHSRDSIFWQWFAGDLAKRLHITEEQVEKVFDDYLVGATRRHGVIFWQIDHQGRVHGGHIMQYRSDGHRDGYQGWTHIPLIRQKKLPIDWQLYQCLFGEHLLQQRPESRVCVVESEKTALVMAAVLPEHIWVATAGSGGLSPQRVECLKGRRVTIFPDSGCYDKWSSVMARTKDIDYNVYRELERFPPNTDLCDMLIAEAYKTQKEER